MTITVNLLQMTGPASAGGTVLGTQSIAAPSTWTELTDLAGTIPPGGALAQAYSDAEAFRLFIMPPSVSAVPPPINGILVERYGSVTAALTIETEFGAGSRVWVKAA